MPQIVGARLQLMDQATARILWKYAGRDGDQIGATSSPVSKWNWRSHSARPTSLGQRQARKELFHPGGLACHDRPAAPPIWRHFQLGSRRVAAGHLSSCRASFSVSLPTRSSSLTRTARTVADHKDYSVREPKALRRRSGRARPTPSTRCWRQIQSQDSALQSAGAKLQEKYSAATRNQRT